MSAPRIKVRLEHSPVWRRKFYWHCTGCTSQFESHGGTADALAAAADAGRAHLRAIHGYTAHTSVVEEHGPELIASAPYSRSCGVSLAACEAQTCRCDKSHVGALGGREKPAQRFDLSGTCAHCGWSAVDCDRHLFGCCAACAATGGCTHDNPLQTAHNESRDC